jgi:cytochrome c oxidase assembly factor CtaG
MRRRLAAIAAVGIANAATLHAHPEHAHELHARQVMTWWTFDPLVIVMLSLSAFLFLRGTTVLWRRAGIGKGVAKWQVAAFAAGWFTLFIALLSPIDGLSDILFSAHMAQHELLMIVAAPLLVLARPLVPMLWALSPRGRERAAALSQSPAFSVTWRFVTGPLVVLLVHAFAVWIWHVPQLFEAALRSEAIHTVQHGMFFVTAILFWWALVHGRYGRIGYGVAVAYVFITATHTTILGALMTIAPRVWYPMYQARAAAWGVRPLEDQQLAGLLMWVPSGVVFLCLALGLFAAWLGEAERRGQLTTMAEEPQ